MLEILLERYHSERPLNGQYRSIIKKFLKMRGICSKVMITCRRPTASLCEKR